ncbi:LysE family translocator [Noviherbaspirillum sp. CPCC 100848]|uniref:LysE family translocator n=1 Tax=Noviherbaspirillum album TaxID=3080276 RepID=A0ABU6J9N5_9BURK|nr:LysE family translocator [Noviherbaspirillum sp. CPCC 100848]MEC4720040.1 LysE family translocator [Noviherbaspirillum sp. CPCC 100848]
MSMILSMAAFALAASISPGPVNIVALGSGARYGFAASMRHVTGATFGFSMLLLLTGLGLHELLVQLPWLTDALRWAGAAFLLTMAWRLATDSGELDAGPASKKPTLSHGAVMQWLNPKAWLAAVAGMGTYAAEGGLGAVWLFTGVYFVVCYLSIASWAWAGSVLQHYLQAPNRIRWFNRTMAAMIAASVIYLLAV